MVEGLFAELMTEAHEDRCERSLPQLFRVFGFPDESSTLERISLAAAELKRWNLCLIPESSKGEIDTIRRVRFSVQPQIDQAKVEAEISAGETERVEFKSSLVFDRQRAANDPGATIQALRSEAVLHSSLKTIAAYLNTFGGLLFVGLDDSGLPVGVGDDLACLFTNPEKHNIDHWQLYFRSRVETSFLEGKSVNDYIECRWLQMDNKIIVRIKVASRRRLSYLLQNKKPTLYRRQGNRTEEVQIHEMEEFLLSKGWQPPV